LILGPVKSTAYPLNDELTHNIRDSQSTCHTEFDFLGRQMRKSTFELIENKVVDMHGRTAGRATLGRTSPIHLR